MIDRRAVLQEMEDWEVLEDRIVSQLPPERRLKSVSPEQRLADLDRDHLPLALPLGILRALSEDYLRTLSPEVQAELRRRLQQNGH
ncbi:MAG: hypothetical protein U0441_03760 [Polyangiaceae bacterium]